MFLPITNERKSMSIDEQVEDLQKQLVEAKTTAAINLIERKLKILQSSKQ